MRLIIVAMFIYGTIHATVAAEETTSAPVRPPEMVTIPTTTFLMGSPVKDESSKAHRPEEKPQHEVTVNEFAIGRFLVTAEEFARFLNAEGNHKYFFEIPGPYDWRTIKKVGDRYVPQKGAERCPAFPVSWVGADAYCKWLAKTLDKPFRLPTEAEWELTARGKELRAWPWGDEPPEIIGSRPPIKLFDYGPDEGSRTVYRDDPDYRPMAFYEFRGQRFYEFQAIPSREWLGPSVGSFPLNETPEGAYDMLGDYSGQWCADVYEERAYDRKEPAAGAAADSESPRSQRGMARVKIRGFKQDRPVLRFLTFLGDATWDRETSGRSWSRRGGHPTKYPGIFRLAMTVPHDDRQPTAAK